MTGQKKHWYQRWITPALFLFSFVLTVLLSYSSPVHELKLDVQDRLFELRGPIVIEDTSVVIVEISQQADQEIPYKYPWPSDMHARLIENLNQAGARAIGFDVIFDQRDNYDLANDTLLAQTLQKYRNVILAANIQVESRSRGQGSRSVGTTLVAPNDVLMEANPNPVGLVRVLRDADTAVRRYFFSMDFQNERYLSMGLELLKLYHGVDSATVLDKGYYRLGELEIPRYSPNTMAINFFGAPGTFPSYSLDTVIDDSTVLLASESPDFQINSFSDPDFGLKHTDVFKDKIVLVGATMPELHDFHATPFATGGGMPGVEIHANAIQTILSENYIYHAAPWINLLLMGTGLLLIVWLNRRVPGIWGFGIYLVLCIFTIGLAVFEFMTFSYIIDVVGLLAALSVGFVTVQSYEYAIEQQEKKRIRNLFSSYVSPAVVEEMIESGKEPKLGGDEVYMTAFFSDIQSFSTFSEQLPAPKLVRLMNEYLSAMTDILTDHGGTLDKYIGDGIVAFFGAPVQRSDHAYKACLVSQLMHRQLDELRKKWRDEEDWPEIVQHMQIRIGINTGLMVTGNMGSSSRFNYTMMGDNVNLAARCESSVRQFGVYTMVTEETKKEAEKFGDRCVFRYLDRIVVKGRTEPVNVYEIMGLKERLSVNDFECRKLFESGISSYHNRQWGRAQELFEQASKLERYQPGDSPMVETNPSLVYLERCKVMKENPPSDDWNGVYVMEMK